MPEKLAFNNSQNVLGVNHDTRFNFHVSFNLVRDFHRFGNGYWGFDGFMLATIRFKWNRAVSCLDLLQEKVIKMTNPPSETMTPQEAIKMLRETLGVINLEMENTIHPPGCEGGNWECPFCAIVGRSTEALYATEQVDDGLVLPELPKGWVIFSLSMDRVYSNEPYLWDCRLDTAEGLNMDEMPYAEAESPRAAVLAAIAKIGEGK